MDGSSGDRDGRRISGGSRGAVGWLHRHASAAGHPGDVSQRAAAPRGAPPLPPSSATAEAAMSTERDPPRVVVKFHDSVDDDRKLAHVVGAFRERFPQLSLEPEFPSMTRADFERLREYA